MARKQSVDSSAEEERARRLTAILQGALSGALPPPKDSPKNNGEALAVPDRPITTAANQVHAAAEALRNVANGQGSAHEAPPPPKKHSKRDKKP
jgi:hypothetical protein